MFCYIRVVYFAAWFFAVRGGWILQLDVEHHVIFSTLGMLRLGAMPVFLQKTILVSGSCLPLSFFCTLLSAGGRSGILSGPVGHPGQ